MADFENMFFGTISIVVVIMLFLYIFIGQLFEAKHFHMIHETGFGILLGVAAGYIFYLAFPNELSQITDFNEQIFFYLLLPLIIFSGGYNLNKKRFFQNFFYVVLYGIIGTVFQFIFMTLFTCLLNDWGWVRVSSDFNQTVTLTLQQIMVYSSTMCASDAVAALTMIKADQYPKLFSVVFGEGMINDAVAIIIFAAVGRLTKNQGTEFSFDWYTTFILLGQFLYEMICSTLIGLFIGFFTTYLFKTFRFITHSCMAETLITLYMGYISFQLCYIVDLSGVISALVCGVVLSHYNFYNMSPLGKVTSQVTINSVSYACESFIYLYLGVSVWTLSDRYGAQMIATSWTFLVQQILVISVSRILMMAFVSLVSILWMGLKKWRLNFWEVGIVWFAGMIRGSVAYALILSLKSDGTSQDDLRVQIIQTTTLFLVIITTVVLGGMMPCFINISLRQASKAQGLDVSSNETFRDTLMGRSNLQGETERSRKFRSRFQNMVKRVDEKVVKPKLIFNYEQRRAEIERSKQLLKMNGPQFDPTLYGRVTVQQQGRPLSVENIMAQLGQSSELEPDMRVSANAYQQAIKSKVLIRSSMNSKFGGHQEIDLYLDVPLIFQQQQEEYKFKSISENSDEEYDMPNKVGAKEADIREASINSG